MIPVDKQLKSCDCIICDIHRNPVNAVANYIAFLVAERFFKEHKEWPYKISFRKENNEHWIPRNNNKETK